jgi:arginyl-tRNA synthetase
VIVFDFKEALSFEGETGVYCQNAAVRLNSIFRKVGETSLIDALSFSQTVMQQSEVAASLNEILHGEGGDDIWSLCLLAERFDEVVRQSAESAEPAYLAKYVFQLARSFNFFYHHQRIIGEENQTKRMLLIMVASLVRRKLTNALSTLGISVPERM